MTGNSDDGEQVLDRLGASDLSRLGDLDCVPQLVRQYGGPVIYSSGGAQYNPDVAMGVRRDDLVWKESAEAGAEDAGFDIDEEISAAQCRNERAERWGS